ncbi:actin-binding LIM protein 2-like [Erythrolamprus reginae]|uniref:actin-binding LIM protein 2-like n=1 Tax=Erythrolamprus reginae TaxID=121349 RepID=UPI00396C88B3
MLVQQALCPRGFLPSLSFLLPSLLPSHQPPPRGWKIFNVGNCGFLLVESSWLTLKGDVDFRTNSPDLDTQSLPQSPGTDRQLQRLQSNTNCTYLRFPYSKSASLPDYGRQGLQHAAAGVGPEEEQEATWERESLSVAQK